jgi:2-oxoglutarate dehydrogenase complex dehydrogenase (E1) component-like enzyme
MGLALTEALGQVIRPITRPASSSPATGSAHAHEREQRELVERAFSPS